MQHPVFSFKTLLMAMTFCAPACGGSPHSAATPPAAKAPGPTDTRLPPQSIRPFQPLSGAERDALLARLKKDSATVLAIRGKFTQASQTAMLVKPEINRGTLTFRKKPMAFRYEYENGNVFVLKDGGFTYWLPAQKLAGKIDLRRYDRLLSKYADPLGIIDHIGDEYQILEAGVRDDRYRLKLAPGAKSQQGKRGPLATVTLELMGSPLAIVLLSAEMKNGDSLTLDFETTELNPVLPDGVFSVKIPAGVTFKESLPSNMNF